MQQNLSLSVQPSSKELRAAKLFRELAHAIQRTPNNELLALVVQNYPKDVALGMYRRVRNLAKLGGSIVAGTAKYGTEMVMAKKYGVLGMYCKVKGYSALGWTVEKTVNTVDAIKRMKDDPKKELIRFTGFALAALASSGGLDANGGLPDTDIDVLGIGAHRSPLTHSIIAGAATEATISLFVLLILCVHKNLPEQHDPLWDAFKSNSTQLLDDISRGVSVGLAYHLLVDGLVQVAPYHGPLPGLTPIEVHQAVFAGNGAAEGLDALNRDKVAYKEFSSFEQASAYAKAMAAKSKRSVQTVRSASGWRVVM